MKNIRLFPSYFYFRCTLVIFRRVHHIVDLKKKPDKRMATHILQQWGSVKILDLFAENEFFKNLNLLTVDQKMLNTVSGLYLRSKARFQSKGSIHCRFLRSGQNSEYI
jgi:hypothetical protein